MGLIDFTRPEGVAWTVFVVSVAIVIAPRLAELVRLPGLIGLIIAGLLISPSGFDIVEVDQLDAIGHIGLLFLMFLAGLELDLNLFKQYQRAAVTFGVLTFIAPFALGAAVAGMLSYDIAATVLIGSIWASHTLVAYPVLRQMDVVDNRAIATTVGATVITDTAALVILAIVVGTETGGESGVTLALGLGLSLALLLAVCFIALPWLSRRFFEGIGQERILRFVWLVAALMGAAELGESMGIEGIVGAFFAGIGLNRLVPNQSALMERTHFFASSLFIPVFLISVGSLIDLEVVAQVETLAYAGLFLAAVAGGKLLAAVVAARLFGFSRPEVGAMFSLSIAQAAATLAATIVGFQVGLLDETFVNAAVVVVSATLFIASLTASRFGPRLAQAPDTAERRLAEHVIVPVLAVETSRPLIDLAAQIAEADGGIVRPVHVVEEGVAAAERKRRLEELEDLTQAAGIDCEPIVRVDGSLLHGIRNAVVEYEGSLVLLGHERRSVVRTLFTGDERSRVAGNVPVPVLMVSELIDPPRRVVIALERGDLVPACSPHARVAIDIAVRLCGSKLELTVVSPDATALTGLLPEDAKHVTSTGGAAAWARANADPGDLFILPGRAGAASFTYDARTIEAMPGVSVAIALAAPSAAATRAPQEYGVRVAMGRTA